MEKAHIHVVRLALALFAVGAAAQEDVTEPQLPDPNRTLTAAEAETLVEEVTVLLDSEAHWGATRYKALLKLAYEIHHRAALPAMRHVAMDADLNPGYRAKALHGMVALGVVEAIDQVIVVLRCDEPAMRGFAWMILTRGIHGHGEVFGFDPKLSVEENEAAIVRYEEWWAQARDTYEVPPWIGAH